MSDHLLGLDWGGGGGRALLFDPEGGTIHTARRPWSAVARPDVAPLASSFDATQVLDALADATREVVARARIAPEQVRGVAVSSVRFGHAMVGADGELLDLAANRDARATGEAFRLAAESGAAFHATGGHWPQPFLPALRAAWLRERRPRLGEAGERLLALSDWVAFSLCGELACDASQASASGVYDLAAGGWSEAWLERLALPGALLPPIVEAGTRLGGLLAPVAERFGLAAGTPVAAGGSDSACALLGSGACEAGDRMVLGGTTAPVLAVTSTPDRDPRLFTERHVAAGRFFLDSNAGAVGDTLAWLASVLFEDAQADAPPVGRLLATAARAAPGAGGSLSSLGAQLFDARQLRLPIGHLSVSPVLARAGASGRADLARAAAEGIAFGLRANLEQLDLATGPPREGVRLAGGLARSPSFAQILADATGRPVACAPCPDASALGAALCAGAGAALFADVASAARPADGTLFEPDAERAARYDELYASASERAGERDGFDAGVQQYALGAAAADAGASAAAGAGVRPRILATCDLDEAGRSALGRLGPLEHASYREKGRLLTGPGLVEALEGVEVFVTEIDLVDAGALAARPELRVVASCRGDAVNVDVEACTAHGVPVLNTPGRNADAVADLTLGFLLLLARKLATATAFLRAEPHEAGDMGRMGRAFGGLRAHELGGRTVGLVGFGAVGRGVARRLRGFGTCLRVHDPYLADEEVRAEGAEPVGLDALLAESDLVSLHAPVTDATRGLLGAAELRRMKPGAAVVNTARAALVDEEALAEALADGHLSGAALDVFSVEPPGSDHPLLQLESVVATPHVGGNTHEVAGHQGLIVARDLERLLRGERPLHVLNPEVLSSFDWSRERPALAPERLAELAARPGPAVTDLQRDAKQKPRKPKAAAPPPGPEPTGGLAAPVREAMGRILEGFVARVCDSEAIRRVSRDRDVTLHFRVPDLDAAFHLRLRAGEVSGAVTPPPEPAEVELTLAADVLDGMFTGRANPMQAAMDGRLAFTGDTAKAMTLQHLQEDLSRLYREARDAAGDPGELRVAGAEGADPTEVAADDPRHELVRVVEELYAQQLITATGGNVSVRPPGTSEVWITPSQLFKGDLRPEHLVRVGLDGRPLDEGARSPSSERMIHCAVYASRPEAAAVIHAHAAHATILANSDLPFVPISTEAAFFGNIPRIPFVMPGTDELARAVGEAIRGEWAVLMKNHGLIVAGRSLRRAADMAEIIERSCEVILGCHAVGREPPALPDEVVETLRKMGDLIA